MDFENAINSSNLHYDDQKRAILSKRPTPIHIVKVDYKNNCRITDAYLKNNQIQTIMAYTVEGILILNVKRLNQKQVFHSITYHLINLNT